eukprot:TRINITY_DN24405_c0_g2_i1.p1 TRINITY_DN24405_c0_g2~~TRINITY_DN24405_c0_g2_i1.p1  ORF type:complete len:1015 (+),score=201.03 TRINITY_DN24405_c0_g2_i1:244-3288(+)
MALSEASQRGRSPGPRSPPTHLRRSLFSVEGATSSLATESQPRSVEKDTPAVLRLRREVEELRAELRQVRATLDGAPAVASSVQAAAVPQNRPAVIGCGDASGGCGGGPSSPCESRFVFGGHSGGVPEVLRCAEATAADAAAGKAPMPMPKVAASGTLAAAAAAAGTAAGGLRSKGSEDLRQMPQQLQLMTAGLEGQKPLFDSPSQFTADSMSLSCSPSGLDDGMSCILVRGGGQVSQSPTEDIALGSAPRDRKFLDAGAPLSGACLRPLPPMPSEEVPVAEASFEPIRAASALGAQSSDFGAWVKRFADKRNGVASNGSDAVSGPLSTSPGRRSRRSLSVDELFSANVVRSQPLSPVQHQHDFAGGLCQCCGIPMDAMNCDDLAAPSQEREEEGSTITMPPLEGHTSEVASTVCPGRGSSMSLEEPGSSHVEVRSLLQGGSPSDIRTLRSSQLHLSTSQGSRHSAPTLSPRSTMDSEARVVATILGPQVRPLTRLTPVPLLAVAKTEAGACAKTATPIQGQPLDVDGQPGPARKSYPLLSRVPAVSTMLVPPSLVTRSSSASTCPAAKEPLAATPPAVRTLGTVVDGRSGSTPRVFVGAAASASPRRVDGASASVIQTARPRIISPRQAAAHSSAAVPQASVASPRVFRGGSLTAAVASPRQPLQQPPLQQHLQQTIQQSPQSGLVTPPPPGVSRTASANTLPSAAVAAPAAAAASPRLHVIQPAASGLSSTVPSFLSTPAAPYLTSGLTAPGGQEPAGFQAAATAAARSRSQALPETADGLAHRPSAQAAAAAASFFGFGGGMATPPAPSPPAIGGSSSPFAAAFALPLGLPEPRPRTPPRMPPPSSSPPGGLAAHPGAANAYGQMVRARTPPPLGQGSADPLSLARCQTSFSSLPPSPPPPPPPPLPPQQPLSTYGGSTLDVRATGVAAKSGSRTDWHTFSFVAQRQPEPLRQAVGPSEWRPPPSAAGATGIGAYEGGAATPPRYMLNPGEAFRSVDGSVAVRSALIGCGL